MDTEITTRDPFADLRGLTVEALEQESTRLHETIADWTHGTGTTGDTPRSSPGPARSTSVSPAT